MFIREGHKGFASLRTIWTSNKDHDAIQKLEPGLFAGMSGNAIWSADCTELGGVVDSPIGKCKAVTDAR